MQFAQSHITSLFENATEGFVITNSKGFIVLVNPAACCMFGYKAEALLNQPIEILIPQRYRPHHVHLRDQFYEAPKNRVMGHGRDLYGQTRSGEDFPVEVSLSTYEQDGERFVIAFIVDITQRKKIENNLLAQQQQLEVMASEMRTLNTELEAKVEERTVILKEALQRLEQSQAELSEALDKERQLNEIKSRFVSMASHEFRTPLSTVLSSASLLGKYTQTAEQEKRERHVEKIKNSVKHLNDLLEDFLSLGRLDEGKIAASFGEVDLHAVVQETVEEMKTLAQPQQKITCIHTGTQNLLTDARLIKNILINLISNAIKFSPPDDEIEVRSGINATGAYLEVQDRGMGISTQDQQHLFSTFFRGHNATNIQGTGLGLHIVKRYTDLLGGTIDLQSALGKGTTIGIHLSIKPQLHAKNHPHY